MDKQKYQLEFKNKEMSESARKSTLNHSLGPSNGKLAMDTNLKKAQMDNKVKD